MCASPPQRNSTSSRGPHQGQEISNMRASMRHGGGAMLVDEPAAGEALETEGRVERVRLAARDRVSEHPARARRRLEAAGAPASVEIEAFHRELADDRRGV